MGTIPANTVSGVLPPYTGATSAERANVSPYQVEISDVVLRYAISTERVEILTGLLEYRKALAALGILSGFQWLDGSFVEDVETIRSRPPGDIDIVTFAHPPTTDRNAWFHVVVSNPNIFDPDEAKKTYKCDAYFVDLSKDPQLVVSDTAYWFNLFSHQRGAAATWKGMLRVGLTSDDVIAQVFL
ncbi:hypothetical protein IVB02_21405 [Bradyrhizobium sp. 166]|uniref:DUF6932 family protein n=1 Tax=Bradyrhizobium sp. 166 TaxID=2782638 RepID=UPI001FFA154B|nr:hypothetical protein [Bradyrhizobium sp. 166]MCK1603924.1 hypothetical protein [Bradyrhizobium sp. 166]